MALVIRIQPERTLGLLQFRGPKRYVTIRKTAEACERYVAGGSSHTCSLLGGFSVIYTLAIVKKPLASVRDLI